jgi:hypothetical protein
MHILFIHPLHFLQNLSCILIEPLLDPIFVNPPLVIDAIQEVPMQDDHLTKVEEEEVKAVTKEAQALRKGTGGNILIAHSSILFSYILLLSSSQMPSRRF